MTELQIRIAIANHPKVQAYRKAVQIMHNRMVSTYGEDYAQEYVPNDVRDIREGVTRMTPLDLERFESLMRGAAIVRKDVRASILATV
jgi:hypothetical protein